MPGTKSYRGATQLFVVLFVWRLLSASPLVCWFYTKVTLQVTFRFRLGDQGQRLAGGCAKH